MWRKLIVKSPTSLVLERYDCGYLGYRWKIKAYKRLENKV